MSLLVPKQRLVSKVICNIKRIIQAPLKANQLKGEKNPYLNQ